MKTLKIAGICAFCGQVSAIFFLLLVSFLVRNSEDPSKNLFLFSMTAACVSSLAAGCYAGYFDRDSPLFCGFLCGVFSAALSLILSVIPGGQKPLWQSVLLLAATVLCSFVAAVLINRYNSGARGRKRNTSRGKKRGKRW